MTMSMIVGIMIMIMIICTETLVEDISEYSFLRCMLSLETLETPVQWTMSSFWIFLFCDNSKHDELIFYSVTPNTMI